MIYFFSLRLNHLVVARYRGKTILDFTKQLTHLAPVDLRGKSYEGLKLQTFAYYVYNASWAVSRCLGRFLLSVFLDAFFFDLTLSITSRSPQFDGVRLRLENFPRILMGYFCCEPFGGSEP